MEKIYLRRWALSAPLVLNMLCLAAGVASPGNTPVTSPPTACPPNITLSSQADVDSFAINYCGCDEIPGYLEISGNDIKNLYGLFWLKHVGSLHIWYNDSLTNLNGLWRLSSVSNVSMLGPGGINIIGNPMLRNVNGLLSLKATTGVLQVSDNASLTNLNGLWRLDSIGGFDRAMSLTITGNPALENIDGLSRLAHVPGQLIIENNASLENVDGLRSITKIGYAYGAGLLIRNNASLENIDGLAALTGIDAIYAYIDISDNPNLKNVDGLASLEQLTQGRASIGLTISNNAALENIDGLSSLTAIGSQSMYSYFELTGNLSLARCCGVYPLLGNNGVGGGRGVVTIAGNGAGCTQEEIVAGGPCSANESLMAGTETLRLYPNPAQDEFNVEVTEGFTGSYALQIRDLSGEIVKEQTLVKEEETLLSQVDLARLPGGTYLLLIYRTDHVIARERLVIN